MLFNALYAYESNLHNLLKDETIAAVDETTIVVKENTTFEEVVTVIFSVALYYL